MWNRSGVLLVICLVIASVSARAETFELIIRNGRIADGTGNPAYFADIAVRRGHIVHIGQLPADAKAKTEIDATGLIVAPGFIDVHTHADEIGEMPEAQNFVRMGVTTVVAGNCGSSELDVSGFFSRVEKTGVSLNVATLLGHGDLRKKVMGGNFERAPTPTELGRMKMLVAQGMKDGAAGLSTGLIYLPGAFATTEELIELAKVAAAYDGVYATHMRHEDTRIFAALDEVIRIAREARIRAEVSHIKLSGPSAWGQAARVLDYLGAARAEGLDITQDQYVYTASSTSLSQLIPDAALEGGRLKERLGVPEQKASIKAEMKEMLRGKGRDSFAYAVIASCRHDPSLNGLNIVEAAKAKRGADSLDDQVETILEIQSKGGASGVFHGMSEEDLQTFLRDPNTAIACDSGLRKLGEGVPHPRGYGNNARVLARYVRELKILRLEDAVRKMTSLPATTFRLRGRGELREGNWADITIFDPRKIQDTATYKEPHHYPEGIPYVVVSGVLVIREGNHTGARPGQALRHRL